jgi:hypothetical protein
MPTILEANDCACAGLLSIFTFGVQQVGNELDIVVGQQAFRHTEYDPTYSVKQGRWELLPKAFEEWSASGQVNLRNSIQKWQQVLECDQSIYRIGFLFAAVDVQANVREKAGHSAHKCEHIGIQVPELSLEVITVSSKIQAWIFYLISISLKPTIFCGIGT